MAGVLARQVMRAVGLKMDFRGGLSCSLSSCLKICLYVGFAKLCF